MSAWTEYMDQLVGVHTAKAVAQKVGVDSSQISRWRNGRSIPSVENVIRLAEAYKGNVAEAMVAAGYIDTETYAEFPVDLEAEDGPVSSLERDPFASISVPKLLKYIAHVVVQSGRIKAATPNIDREISLAAIEIDSLSSGMLLSVLAGSERPVPDHLVASVDALTQYIYGPGEMVDILGIFSRMLQDEPGAHDEAMRLLANKHTTQDRTDEGVANDLETAPQPDASPEAVKNQEVTSSATQSDVIHPRWGGHADQPPPEVDDELAAASIGEKASDHEEDSVGGAIVESMKSHDHLDEGVEQHPLG